MNPYVKLFFAALLAPIVAALLWMAEKKTRFGKIGKTLKQLIIGVVFGCLAIIGTEWGVDINGAQVNCRDGAVLTAGLFFGGPAGIIAGLIGGIERWFSVLWGIGTYTRVACTISTIIAGFYSAALRKYLFDDERPGILMSTAVGVVIEVFHLTMVYVTNMNDAAQATYILRHVSAIQIICNSLTVGIASVMITLLNKEKLIDIGQEAHLNIQVQRRMLYAFIITYCITAVFTVNLQKGASLKHTEETLRSSLSSLAADAVNNPDVIRDAHDSVGVNGFLITFTPDMKQSLNFSGKWEELSSETINLLEKQTDNELFNIKEQNTEFFAMSSTGDDYRALAVIPQDEAFELYYTGMIVTEFMEILICAILFGMIYLLIRKQVVEKLVSVNDSLHRITEGQLDEQINVRSSSEFIRLSDDINSTVNTLKEYISDAEKRMEAELELARNIQASALPGDGSVYDGHKEFEVYGVMEPAKEVGGDFYDFYLTEQTRLNFMVADVSGKGIPAAMFMMTAKTELNNLTLAGNTIERSFTISNNALCEHNDAGMFVTAWQGQLNLENGSFHYVNAGHNPPLIRRKGGAFEYLRGRSGFVLAGMEGMKYKSQKLILEPGDVIFLYTDGVTEATDCNNRLYGEQRLIDTVNSVRDLPVKELCRYVKDDVESFVGNAPQFDDITMVAVRYLAPCQIREEFRLDFAAAEIDDVEKTMVLFEKEMEDREYPTKVIRQISVAIDELMSNIIKYGYPEHKGPISVSMYELTGTNMLKIQFTDRAIPFDPTSMPEPDISVSADKRQIGGLGIMMVRKIMDGFDYVYEDGKNVVTLYKRLN